MAARVNIRDVAVVGAGPAGALVATCLARSGADVVLLDRQRFPRDKVCGCCMSAGTLALLRRAGLGDLPELRQAAPLRELSIRAGARDARLPLSGSVAVERRVLDLALVRCAVESGVDFLDGLGVVGLDVEQDAVQVETRGSTGRDSLRARVVVDASGLGGLAGGPTERPPVASPESHVGVGAVFEASPPALQRGVIHMAVGRSGYVGMVCFPDGRLNVAAALSPFALRSGVSPGSVVGDVLAEVGLELPDCEPQNGWKGTRPLTQRPTAVASARVFRVGDAAGYVEPFTGEGMAWAFAGALAAAPIVAEAAARWTPAHAHAWTRAHARITLNAQRLCRAVAWGLRRPRLVRGVVRALEHAPAAGRPFVRLAEAAPSVP